MKTIFSILLLAAAGLLFSAEGIRTFSSGDISVTAIQDRRTRMPSSLFLDTLRNNPVKMNWPQDWDSSTNVFLIRSGGKNILIDAGWQEGKGTLLKKLKTLNLDPKEIHAILITHIHPDHVGGLLTKEGTPAFPNALICIPYQEYSIWLKRDSSKARSMDRFLAPCKTRILAFRYDTPLMGGLVAREAAGHTPGHAVYELGPLLFVGDLVHAAELQINFPNYCAQYDMNPEEAVRTRIRLLSSASEKKQWIFGAHIPFPGAGTVQYVRKSENGIPYYFLTLRP